MLEIYRDEIDLYRYQIKAKNNMVIAKSVAYYCDRRSCLRGARALLTLMGIPEHKKDLIIENVKELG